MTVNFRTRSWALLAVLLLQCSLFQPGNATIEPPVGSDQVLASEPAQQAPIQVPATAAVPSQQPPAAAGHAPTITYVNVPAVVPANGQKVPATITFTDGAQDVVSVLFKTISPSCCIADSTLDATTRTTLLNGGGVISFDISCDAPQQVTMSATLRDFEMQQGNTYQFSYTCQ